MANGKLKSNFLRRKTKQSKLRDAIREQLNRIVEPKHVIPPTNKRGS